MNLILLFAGLMSDMVASRILELHWRLGNFARAFNRSGDTRAIALDISKAFDRVWHANFFHKLNLMKFQVRYLALFLLFSVIGGLWWFWMGNLHKNIQLMLVLHFSYYTSMTFRMILSVIFLYMLMILLSTLNVIRHLICGNSLNWLLNLNLTYETLDLARK